MPVTFTDGTTADLRVGAIYGADDLPGPYVVARAAWAPHAVQDLDNTVYVALANGVSMADGTAAVERVAAGYGTPQVLDRAGFVAQSTDRVNVVLGLVYAFGWEPAVLMFPGYLKRLTVAYYLQGLVTHEMPQDSAVSMVLQLFHDVPTVFTSLLCLSAIIAVTLWSAGRAVEQREYVLEQ